MPLQIFVINGCILCEPLLHQRTVHVVVIAPVFVAGVVGRIDIDTLDTVGIAREQRFKSVQVVTVDDKVIVRWVILDGGG